MQVSSSGRDEEKVSLGRRFREPGEREVYLPQERDAAVPSRDPGRDIPVRVVSEQGQLDTRPFEVWSDKADDFGVVS